MEEDRGRRSSSLSFSLSQFDFSLPHSEYIHQCTIDNLFSRQSVFPFTLHLSCLPLCQPVLGYSSPHPLPYTVCWLINSQHTSSYCPPEHHQRCYRMSSQRASYAKCSQAPTIAPTTTLQHGIYMPSCRRSTTLPTASASKCIKERANLRHTSMSQGNPYLLVGRRLVALPQYC